MRKVELRMNEQIKYKTIKELVEHNRDKNRAAKKQNNTRCSVDCENYVISLKYMVESIEWNKALKNSSRLF